LGRLVTLAVFLTDCIGTAQAGPVYARYQVENDDPVGRTATDLTLTFNKPVLTETINNTKIAKDAESFTFGGSNTLNPGKTVDFSSTTKGVRMGQVDLGVVAFPAGTNGITAASGSWSYPVGADRPIPLKQIMVSGWKKDNGVVFITNNESQTVYFSSVRASTNLPSSNFLDPTSSQLLALITNNLYATGVEPDFSLAAGSTKEIDLGPDMGDNYTSVSFVADFSPTPSSTDPILSYAGNEEVVPEPASWTMLALGLIVAAGHRRWSINSDLA